MADTDWMLAKDDPARQDIVARAQKLGIKGNPGQAAHALGQVTLADGRKVNAFVVHAVDPVITDGTEVVMINRKFPPSQGMPALPGGMLDPTNVGVESAIQAAAREAMEEAGISLDASKAVLVGKRNMNRPFDVRVAKGEGMEKYGIHDGDIFMVSTQGVRFDVPDLSKTKLIAGDDAQPGSARRVSLRSLSKDQMGIPDHFDMIAEALDFRSPVAKFFKGGRSLEGAKLTPVQQIAYTAKVAWDKHKEDVAWLTHLSSPKEHRQEVVDALEARHQNQEAALAAKLGNKHKPRER